MRDSKILIGRSVAVPTLTGRGRWWVTIINVSYVGDSRIKGFVKVRGGRSFGPDRWVDMKDVSFK